ncbi:MAG: TSUP family transporter [Actinomycetota bacterium]
MPPLILLFVLAVAAAAVGALGGLGGATILVPVLVLSGMEPAEAAPLGLLTVAAGSLAAAATQLDEGVVHHRLGITLETAASAGAIAGAAVSASLSATTLSRVLAASAIAAAVAGGRRKGMRNTPQGEFAAEPAGEWPGTLSGAYLAEGRAVPYQARRLPLGLGAMGLAGLVSGLSGVGGGFIKTPAMSELMHVPVKVAAATTTFTLGITAAAGLVVFTVQDRIDPVPSAAIVLGGLAGGLVGARLQRRLAPQRLRSVLSVVLLAIGLVLLVRA